MPWVAMGFMTLYLQLLGFADMTAALLVALFSLGAAIGSFGGGYIGAHCVSLQCPPMQVTPGIMHGTLPSAHDARALALKG
jgi:hypothetical protein